MPDVVMPVWINDEETLGLTVAAVESIRAEEVNLIIVDNGSGHGGGKLRELADVYIRNKTNLGYAKAVNQGLKLSGDFVAVANNDILVSPNWWQVSKEILEDDMVGTVHFRMIPYGSELVLGESTFKTGRERWCTGSFFVTRNGWLFDETFLNSYDDWSYQVTIREDGFNTVYTTKACYSHLDSHTQKKIVNREDNNARNREYFRTKHGMYPEDLYLQEFPDQMSQDWRSLFEKL